MKNRICTIAIFGFAARHKNVTRKDLQISMNYMICFLKKMKKTVTTITPTGEQRARKHQNFEILH